MDHNWRQSTPVYSVLWIDDSRSFHPSLVGVIQKSDVVEDTGKDVQDEYDKADEPDDSDHALAQALFKLL
jgi:hypothetical protein